MPVLSRNSWDRRHGEPSRAFHAFVTFRDLEPKDRTLTAAAAEFYEVDKASDSQRAQFTEWAKTHDWWDRVRDWDTFVDQSSQKATVQSVVRMREKHAAIAEMMLAKVAERVRDLDPADLSPTVLVQWARLGVEMERAAVGDVVEVAESDHTPLTGTARSVLSEIQAKALPAIVDDVA